MKKTPLALVAALLVSLSVAVAALAAPDPAPAPQKPAVTESRPTSHGPGQQELAQPSIDRTYVVCYFKTAQSSTWRWALESPYREQWYTIPGNWSKTPFTKLEKFFTGSVKESDLDEACGNAKAYYRIPDPLFAIFAATSNTGSNYPIVLSGTELYPAL